MKFYKKTKLLTLTSILWLMSVPALSATEDGPSLPAVRAETSVTEFGTGRTLLGRLLRGPAPRIQERREDIRLSFNGSHAGTISFDNLRGGLVSYDTVETLEFHTPILNSPWFFKVIHKALKANGVSPLTRKKNYVTVNVPRSEVRQSLKLIPEILDQNGDAIAEDILKQLKVMLKVDAPNLDSVSISEVVTQTGLSVDEVKELRRFLISNSLNENELIDAIHLSTYKASHLVALKLRRATGLIRIKGSGAVPYSVAALSTVGGGTWALSSVLTYWNQLTQYGLQWGEGFSYRGGYREILTYKGQEFNLDSRYSHLFKDSLEVLEKTGFDASSLIDRSHGLSVSVPHLEMGLAAASILSLGYFAPKLWQQSKPYLALLRNRFLNGYLQLMRAEGLLTNRMVERNRAEAVGLIQMDEDLVIERDKFNFADASEIAEMKPLIDNLSPAAISKDGGFATQIMLLGQKNMLMGIQVLGQFTGDMANWITIAKFYKRQLNEVVRTERIVDFKEVTVVTEAYRARLTSLSDRIEAYEKVVEALSEHVLQNITFLEELLESNQYREYIELRTDSVSDYDERARRTIEDRISDLVAFKDGTLTIIKLSLSNAFETNYGETRDLSRLVQILSTATLANTAESTAELSRTVQDLISRKVGELVSKPEEAILVTLDETPEIKEISPVVERSSNGLSCKQFL